MYSVPPRNKTSDPRFILVRPDGHPFVIASVDLSFGETPFVSCCLLHVVALGAVTPGEGCHSTGREEGQSMTKAKMTSPSWRLSLRSRGTGTFLDHFIILLSLFRS